MSDTLRSGEEIFAGIESKVMKEMAAGASTPFAGDLKTLAIENVFARLWGRPGLDARSRSLVTLGILIALRAEDELQIHTAFALQNGVTIRELEEVIYHSSGYAGFPAATAAMRAATEALRKEGLLD